MPAVTIQMFPGRSLDDIRALVASVTDAVVEALGVKPAEVRVVVEETPRHAYAIGGILAVDWPERERKDAHEQREPEDTRQIN